MKTMLVGMIVAFMIPAACYAFPFGGSVGSIALCLQDGSIYTMVGPPRGGPMIWTPSTMTYQFGPPRHTGQWVLGLSGMPYYCVVSILPLIVWPGISMTMMGSSQ